VTAVNDAPQLVNNQFTVNQGQTVTLTSSNLSATDIDSAEANLLFIVNDVQHGQFVMLLNPGVSATSFTQQNIINGFVRFIHDGSANAPSYTIIVGDGLATTLLAAGIINFIPAPIISSTSVFSSSSPSSSTANSDSSTISQSATDSTGTSPSSSAASSDSSTISQSATDSTGTSPSSSAASSDSSTISQSVTGSTGTSPSSSTANSNSSTISQSATDSTGTSPSSSAASSDSSTISQSVTGSTGTSPSSSTANSDSSTISQSATGSTSTALPSSSVSSSGSLTGADSADAKLPLGAIIGGSVAGVALLTGIGLLCRRQCKKAVKKAVHLEEQSVFFTGVEVELKRQQPPQNDPGLADRSLPHSFALPPTPRVTEKAGEEKASVLSFSLPTTHAQRWETVFPDIGGNPAFTALFQRQTVFTVERKKKEVLLQTMSGEEKATYESLKVLGKTLADALPHLIKDRDFEEGILTLTFDTSDDAANFVKFLQNPASGLHWMLPATEEETAVPSVWDKKPPTDTVRLSMASSVLLASPSPERALQNPTADTMNNTFTQLALN
jgi:hypothetical protein